MQTGDSRHRCSPKDKAFGNLDILGELRENMESCIRDPSAHKLGNLKGKPVPVIQRLGILRIPHPTHNTEPIEAKAALSNKSRGQS